MRNIYKRAGSTTVFQFTKSLQETLLKGLDSNISAVKKQSFYVEEERWKHQCWEVACLSYSQNLRSKLN